MPDLPRHESLAELLAAEEVDAVILATPAATHLDDARLASEAGLPALVEKPPAATAAEAGEMAGLARAPWIGFSRRFEPGLERLRSRVPAEGELELELELHHRGAWGAYTVTDDVLAAVGTHLIDLAMWLSRSDIAGATTAEVEPEHARATLKLGRGSALISCRKSAPHRDRVEVRQGGRTVARHVGNGTLTRVVQRLRRPTSTALVALLAAQLEEFAAAARGEPASTLATAADGAAVMEAMEAIRAAGNGHR